MALIAPIFALLIVLGIFAFAILAIIRNILYVCEPSEVLVFSGRTRQRSDGKEVGYRFVKGGRAYRVPLIETVDRMDLTNMIIDLQVKGAYSRNSIPLLTTVACWARTVGAPDAPSPSCPFAPLPQQYASPVPLMAQACSSPTDTFTVLLIVNVLADDVSAFGAGLLTVTALSDASSRSVALIVARSCVVETNVVVRAAPFQRTVAPLMKLAPFTVRVSAVAPSVELFGDSDEIDGATGTGAAMVTVRAALSPPLGAGLNTVTCAVPTAATSAVLIVTVSCVLDTRVVGRAVPLHRTVAPSTN